VKTAARTQSLPTPWRKFRLAILVLLLFFWLCGCTPQREVVPEAELIPNLPESFQVPEEYSGILQLDRWWLMFDDPVLDRLIETSLDDNFSLQQYYARLRQSFEVARKTAAELSPELEADLSYGKRYNRERDDINDVFAGLQLSWELDLWNRLSSAAEAARLDTISSREELEAAALLLTSEIASTYFSLIERNAQYHLLTQQIETNNKTLKILRMRFSYGGSSLVDVYQQQEQLVATEAGIPQVLAEITVLRYRLSVLLGQPPDKDFISGSDSLPQLPAAPSLGVPADLLLNRPDLRAAANQLQAAGYRIDVARADRLPRIGVGARAGFDGSGLRGDELFTTFLAELVAPILDGGRRQAEVRRTEAFYDELVARFNQRYLVAIEEVQSALWREANQFELISKKEEQLEVARAALLESQKRYLQGVSDYLPVLTALFSTQRLEREIISLKKDLILIRVSLCQAIGSGTYLSGQST
jgi:NodT family efflux transporter outer membrane factor (OMF) lipoprotein